MDLEIDPDVKAVAEFMQANMTASHLVAVAQGVADLAPLLWGRYGKEDVSILLLRSTPLTASPCGRRKRESAARVV